MNTFYLIFISINTHALATIYCKLVAYQAQFSSLFSAQQTCSRHIIISYKNIEIIIRLSIEKLD